MKNYGSITVMRRCWKMSTPYKKFVYLGIVLTPLIICLSIVSSYTLSIIVDVIIPDKRVDLLWYIQLVFIGAVLLENGLAILKKRLICNAGQKALCDLRLKMLSKYLRADYLKKSSKAEAELNSTLNYNVDALSGALENGIPSIVCDCIDIIITVTIMFIIDWRLALLSIPVFPALFFASKFMRSKISKAQTAYQSSRLNFMADIADASNCSANIYNFNLEGYMENRFRKSGSNIRKKTVRMDILYELMGRMSWAMIMVPYQAILYGVGGMLLITSGVPTIGVLLVFANFTNHLLQPVMNLMNTSNNIGSAQAVFESIDAFNSSLPESAPRFSAKEDVSDCVAIAEKFSYKYPNQAAYCITDLDCRLERGKLSILWGKSGCGKSTFIKTLFGLLPSDSASLRRDGKSKWGYFPQEPRMMRLSLAENFRLAKVDITEEEIFQLLAMVSVDKAVKEKPDGLNVKMDYGESSFSLGEYRRLCLAVFCAAQFDVMLFDEPTASLDADNAQAVIKMLSELKTERNKTVIVASHDESLLGIADSVIELGE